MNTSSEMLLDALYLSIQNISADTPIDIPSAIWLSNTGESVPPKDIFNVSWRPGADRVIIVFSDEFPQSYLKPKISVSQVIASAQATPQMKIYTFSTGSAQQWDEISQQCGGKHYPLSNSSVEMYNYLMEILDEICMPPIESP